MDHDVKDLTLVTDFSDTDDQCTIKINGRSLIQGTYNNQKGTLTIQSVNDRSEIVLKGRCSRVVIEYLDGQSFIDLFALQVGDGGLLINYMNGQCRVRCQTTGQINVRDSGGQCTVFYVSPNQPIGNLKDDSRFVPLNP